MKYFLLGVFTLLAGIGQASAATADNQTSSSNDPYETYNRHAFALNDTVDKVIYRPVATIYKTITPNIAQKGISHFFSNLNNVPVIANDLLQGKIYQGTQDLWRLFFNTTVGVGGLFDVATKIGLPAHEQDFGMTLSRWGYENSNYFVIPFLGPSTVRDTVGKAVDYQVLSVYPYINNVRVRNSLVALDFIQLRAQLLKFQDVVDAAAVDPYVFQRNAYMQHRMYALKNNRDNADGVEASTSMDEQDKDPYVAE